MFASLIFLFKSGEGRAQGKAEQGDGGAAAQEQPRQIQVIIQRGHNFVQQRHEQQDNQPDQHRSGVGHTEQRAVLEHIPHAGIAKAAQQRKAAAQHTEPAQAHGRRNGNEHTAPGAGVGQADLVVRHKDNQNHCQDGPYPGGDAPIPLEGGHKIPAHKVVLPGGDFSRHRKGCGGGSPHCDQGKAENQPQHAEEHHVPQGAHGGKEGGFRKVALAPLGVCLAAGVILLVHGVWFLYW